MEDQEYTYQLKPLIIPGGIYLISFPIVCALLWFGLKASSTELSLLLGIYTATLLGTLALWIYAHSKSIRVEQDQLVLRSIAGENNLAPGDIRRISLYKTRQGKELVQIKTRKKDFYLTDLYFPFPELMADLEQFIKAHNIRTNFTSI